MGNNRLFERYLFKKLNDSELMDFEERLQNDPEFKMEFHEHKKLQHSFDLLIEDEVLSVIQNIKKSKHNKIEKRFSLKRILSSAAVLLILVCSIFAFNPPLDSLEMTRVGKKHISTTERSASKSQTQISSQKKILNNIDSKFEEPLTQVKMQEVIDEIQTLDISHFSKKEIQKLEWCEALAQVGVDKKNGKKYLQVISSKKNHLYAGEAKMLLKQYSLLGRLFGFSFP